MSNNAGTPPRDIDIALGKVAVEYLIKAHPDLVDHTDKMRQYLSNHVENFPKSPEELDGRSYVGFVGAFQRADGNYEMVSVGLMHHDRVAGGLLLRLLEGVGSQFGQMVSLPREFVDEVSKIVNKQKEEL